MKILIIADDLSGAADCAIGFAGAGHRTVVMLEAMQDGTDARADTTAIDTDTRRLTPAEAAARTTAAYATLRTPGQRLYKKIDSTLRGNWAVEVAALQQLAGLAVVAPAFPATGRTLRGGRVLVHGAPLERTETWRLENMGREADVAAMLADAGLSTKVLDAEALRDNAGALAAQIETIASTGVQALIVDAQTEHALRTLARATLYSEAALFWVGSGGLAREIASLTGRQSQRMDVAEEADAQPICAGVEVKLPILIMVGSLSAVSSRQSEILRASGVIEELIVPPAVLREGVAHAQWAAFGEQIGDTLAAGNDLLLRIGRDDAFDPAEGAQLSAALAALVEPHFPMARGLIATGGETARAMLSAARIDALQLIDEVEAGVAIGKPLGANGEHCPRIVTKAGAFGTDNALYSAWLRLRREATSIAGVR
jgi:D-threonate/D-erythronate kinase